MTQQNLLLPRRQEEETNLDSTHVPSRHPRVRSPMRATSHHQLRSILSLYGDPSYDSVLSLQGKNTDVALRGSVSRVVTRMSLPSEEFPLGSFEC